MLLLSNCNKLKRITFLNRTFQFTRYGTGVPHIIAELRRPEGPPSGAPYPSHVWKVKETEKETHEPIFSWLSWPAVLLVGAYARRRRWSCATWRPCFDKKCTLGLQRKYAIFSLRDFQRKEDKRYLRYRRLM